MNFPHKKYQIIYPDLPLHYKDMAKAGNRGAQCKYPVMSDQQLLDLPIEKLADENCFLFLWATWPKIQLCLDCIKSWGFEYKTKAFTWIKTNQNGSIFMGMGNYTRANDEFILLATKGKPKRINASISSIVMAPVKEHSKKPDIFRTKILQLCGDLPRIELFARTKIHGWDVWGNDEKLQLQPLEAFTS